MNRLTDYGRTADYLNSGDGFRSLNYSFERRAGGRTVDLYPRDQTRPYSGEYAERWSTLAGPAERLTFDENGRQTRGRRIYARGATLTPTETR